jgi:hypothetical protein
MALLERLGRRARAPDIPCRLESAPFAAIHGTELGLSVAHKLAVVDFPAADRTMRLAP